MNWNNHNSWKCEKSISDFQAPFVSLRILRPSVWHGELFKCYRADCIREDDKLDHSEPSSRALASPHGWMETGTDGRAPPGAILTPLFADWWPTTHSNSTDLKIQVSKTRDDPKLFVHDGKTDDRLVTCFCCDCKQLLPRKYKHFGISMSKREQVLKRERHVARQICGHLPTAAEILQPSPRYI